MKNNVKILILFLLCSSMLNAQTIVSTTQENKKAIVEKFTGINCNYCPCADVVINNAISLNPENIIVLKVHEGGYAIPQAGQPDFRTAYGDAMSAQSGNTGNPAFAVNRHFFPNYTSNGGTAIGGCYSNASGIALQSPPTYAIDEILLEPAYLNVAADAIIDYSTGNLTVNTEIYYTDSSPNSTNFLQIAIIQDNTIAYQSGSSLAPGGTNYDHDARLVDLITGQWGEEINSTTVGSFVERTHTYSIPDNYNGVPVVYDDLKVVVYVTESTQEVINGNRANMEYNIASYDLSLDSIDSPSGTASFSENESLSVTISNGGENDISDFDISFQVNDGSLVTENYSGTLISGNTIQYTFDSTYDFSQAGDYLIAAFVSTELDEVENNNSTSVTITSYICPELYSLPYLNDFNDTESFTSCNTFVDSDGDGNGWTSVAFSIDNGNRVADSQSYNGSALSPDNWLIMGPIDLTNAGDTTLTWLVRGIDPSYCGENYSVYISDSNDIASFTSSSLYYDETISSGSDACGNNFAERSLDISSAAGQQIYIGFRHYDIYDMFRLNIDDVRVEGEEMGVNDFDNLNINIYPNPSNGIFKFNVIEDIEYKISNILGQNILEGKFINGLNNIDISEQPDGVYIIRLSNIKGLAKSYKLIKE